MMNWDDLRVFIALSQAGSFAGAAARLGMDATTVARRIQRLESGLRATLVVRGADGLHLTAAGLRLSERGAAFEAAMAAAEEGVTSPLAGTVRLSVAEGLGAQILAPAILRLMDRPGLRIEIDASPGFLSPTTRKVDLAVTSSPPGGSRLIVERLTDYELGLYASASYLERQGAPAHLEDLQGHEFVGAVEDLVYSDELLFLEAFAPRLRQRLTCSSMKMQIAMAAAGAGIGAFPHFLAADNPDLRPVLADLTVTRTYWMATHQELYDVVRVRLVRNWLHTLALEHAAQLTPSLYLGQAAASGA